MASMPSMAPAAPPAAGPPANAAWYDKLSADAFVDAYGSINWNFPKPQIANPSTSPLGSLSGPPGGGNTFHAFDVAQGFALNWIGVNASYTSDTIGGTIGLRIGPSSPIYNSGTENLAFLSYVKQAYATWKAADKLTLDFGKFDQPFGSEVADSQLNMNYGRSVLFWYVQPLFFTGLRATIPVADQFSLLAFAANGWNNSVDNNRGKSFGLQAMIKPADQLTMYIGYVTGPEQNDFGTTTVGTGATATTVSGDVPDANGLSNWRHMVDFVADINPTKELRFLLNADWRSEDNMPVTTAMPFAHHAVGYGANLVARYSFSDAFYGSLRGEFFHDEHGDLLGVAPFVLPATPPATPPSSVNIEDVTLTLAYGIGNHLALMLDNRLDVADSPYFLSGSGAGGASALGKSQFTTTLGVIASTK